jgi:hypothetical protein
MESKMPLSGSEQQYLREQYLHPSPTILQDFETIVSEMMERGRCAEINLRSSEEKYYVDILLKYYCIFATKSSIEYPWGNVFFPFLHNLW